MQRECVWILRLQRPVHLVRIHIVLSEGNAVSAVLRVLPEQICRLIDVIHRLRLQIREPEYTAAKQSHGQQKAEKPSHMSPPSGMTKRAAAPPAV